MARKITMTLKREVIAAASAEFFHFYGHAMSRWSSLERALYYWFAGITGMTEGMARSIFYSARGFGARAEMLESAIEFATKQTPAEIAFIKEALKKARTYSAFRNRMAHGEPQMNVTQQPDETIIHYTLVQGKDVASANDPAVTIEDLIVAADNITKLQQYILDLVPFLKKQDSKSPEECLALVLALPSQPHSKSALNPSAGEQSAEGPVRRDKKAYRAEQQAKSKPDGE